MNQYEQIVTIVVIVVGTMMTRFVSFILFPENKNPPEFIIYLGKVLPYSVIGLLIVFCIKDAILSNYLALPEVISVIVVAIIHMCLKNTLISIAIGACIYMFLVQNVFL